MNVLYHFSAFPHVAHCFGIFFEDIQRRNYYSVSIVGNVSVILSRLALSVVMCLKTKVICETPVNSRFEGDSRSLECTDKTFLTIVPVYRGCLSAVHDCFYK